MARRATDQAILIPSFDGGMHLQTNPLLIRENEASIAKNVDLDEIGTLKKCKGYSIFGDQPTTDKVLALFAFYKIGETITRYLLRDSGGNVYQYNFSTDKWDAITGATGLDKDIYPTWIVYQNLAIRFNGKDNPKKFDGENFGDLGGSPPNGDVAALYKDRIYVSGVSPNYSTLYWSEVGNPEKWPASNNVDVNNNDGDKIVALVPLFDSLIIFKEYSIWEWQVDMKNNPAFLRYITKNIGTTSARSVKNLNGIVYFFNRKGVWMLAQKYPELISLKIDKFIRAIQNPYDVVAFTDGNKYCLYVGDLTVDGRDYPNTVLVYDTLYNQWTIKCLAHKMTTITSFIKEDKSEVIYFGSDNGQCYLWNDGYSFAGVPIEVEYETKMFQPGDPKYRKLFKKVLVRLDERPNSPPEISYSIDHRDYISMGLAEKVYTELPIVDRNNLGSGREEGKDIRLRIHEVSTQQMKPIYQIIIYYEERQTELQME